MRRLDKFSMGLVALTFGFAILLLAQQAMADVLLDFNMDAVHPASASISFAGGTNPLVGVNISVDNVVGLGTPVNDGVVLAITGGDLDFTTGNLVSTEAEEWFFGSGGTITLAGNIGNGVVNLISGTFTSAQVEAVGSTFKVTIASFTDVKDPGLIKYFGLDSSIPSWNGNLNLSFFASGLPPNAFTSSRLGSGDITNQPVPEPASLLLLGSGLLGVYGFLRRRK
jgi:hypothetical protein